MTEVDEGWLMATWLATAGQWKSPGDNLGYQWVPSVGHEQSTSKRRSFADAARASVADRSPKVEKPNPQMLAD